MFDDQYREIMFALDWKMNVKFENNAVGEQAGDIWKADQNWRLQMTYKQPAIQGRLKMPLKWLVRPRVMIF